MSVEQIREEALKLPSEDRERLAQELWDSVDVEEDPELVAELNRRWDEMVTGKVQTIPWEQVKAELDERLGRLRAERQLPSKS